MRIHNVLFSAPAPPVLAWHIRLALEVPLPCRVLAVQVNGAAADDWALVQGSHVVPTISGGGSHGVRKPALHVSSASAGGELVAERGAPALAVYQTWQAGQSYTVRLEVQDQAGQRTWLEASAVAPSQDAFPLLGWACQRLFRMRETAGVERCREPVEVLLSAYGDECSDWSRELRVLTCDAAGRNAQAVPFQVVRQVKANHTAPGRREQVNSAWVVAFIDVAARAETLLVCAWGKADAEAADMTAFGPDLQVDREAPEGVTVRNASYRAVLSPRSGQISDLQPQTHPGAAFYYNHGGSPNHFLHYNPDLWVPGSVWTHASDWNPPPYALQSEGPLVLRTRRWGALPNLHGVSCSVEYTFYAWTPWIRTRTVLEVEAILTTNAIRNEEIVLNADQVDRVAWKETDGAVHDQVIAPDPDLPAGVVAIIRNEAPWIAFYDGKTGAGIAGIRLGQQATTRGAGERAYWNTGTLVADYGWGFRYWSRSLIYGTGDFWPDRECVVEPGALYTDECAYMPIDIRAEGSARFSGIDAAETSLRQPIERIWSGSGPY